MFLMRTGEFVITVANFVPKILLFCCFLTLAKVELEGLEAHAEAENCSFESYHWVGLVNTVVPGGGQAYLGNYGLALTQATLETVTAVYGYSNSPRQPVTLDGAPERIPRYKRRKKRGDTRQEQVLDIRSSLWADWAQEFGIKYHMVNVYESYREAATSQCKTSPIDYTPTYKLFLAPFLPQQTLSPWVLAPLLVSAGVIYWDYSQTSKANIPRSRIFNSESNTLYALTYIGMFPLGSAAPEEMFFRGYLQNEFYSLVPSPFFSIPITTALFALAHDPESRPLAAVGGLIFGTLAHMENSSLSHAIAYHFWVDVLTGIESYLLFKRAQIIPPPVSVKTPIRKPPAAAPRFTLFQFQTGI